MFKPVTIFEDLKIHVSVLLRFYEICRFEWDKEEETFLISFNYEREPFNNEKIESLCHELEHYDLTKLLKSWNISTGKSGLYPEWITSNPSFLPGEENKPFWEKKGVRLQVKPIFPHFHISPFPLSPFFLILLFLLFFLSSMLTC